MALSKEAIDEELLNHDLINSGGVENQVHLQEMNLEEKKNLLKGIKQSKEERFTDPAVRSISQSVIDTSSSNFPSLPTPGKSNERKNKLKLPRKQPSVPKASDSEDSSDKCISLIDDEECITLRFKLPFFIDDGGPDLPMPERPIRRVKNPYYVMKHEAPAVALKRMLTQHDTWKAAYILETRIETNALLEELEDSESKEPRDSPKTHKVEEKENDPYIFSSGSPAPLPKVYNGGRKRETNLSSENVPHQSGRQLQRKASRDSDCEEVETILKPEDPKLGDWITTRKRNRKQLFNQDKGQSYENSPDVEFNFEEKWDAGSSTWQNTQQNPSSSSLNNQVQGRRSLSNQPLVEEEKVQCPICQRNFPQSKVENHAATCEGFSGSPMDIEEEQD